jgi:hypothetical protein
VKRLTDAGGTTDVKQISENIPSDFNLMQNYPNPFNPVTNIEFSVSKQAKISIKIYNVLGQEIMTLVNDNFNPGIYNVKMNSGKLSSGIYYYTMLSENNIIKTLKLTVVK